MKKNILITGGEGVLAQYVKSSLKNFKILSPGHQQLDLTKEKQIEKFFIKNKPDIVIHLAAQTDVDRCEQNPQEAFLVNSEGTKNIVQACKKNKSFLVYVSTAAVFDGNKDIFYEEDDTNPLNIYGISKFKGEKYVQDLLDDYLIFRAAWLIGGGKKEKKFISYIMNQLSQEKEIKVVNDKFGTLTYAKELADKIKEFLDLNKTGVFHFGSKGVCSRYDIANRIISIMSKKVKITPVSSKYFLSNFSAPRPNREVIGSKKIKFLNSWEKSLEDYLRNELTK